MSLLFDTPGLSTKNTPIASTSTSTQSIKKRKRNDSNVTDSTEGGNGLKQSVVEMNLGKLMKKMKEMERDSGWGGNIGAGGKTGVEQSEKDSKKKEGKKNSGNAGSNNNEGGKKKNKEINSGSPIVKKDSSKDSKGGKGSSTASPIVKPKPNRFEPAKKEKKSKKDKLTFSPASSSNSIHANHSNYAPEAEPEPVRMTPTRHQAPNSEEIESNTSNIPQTNMQIALRAKLAGGKFRLLNESLYTSTGEEAWSTMKEEGAFDDVS